MSYLVTHPTIKDPHSLCLGSALSAWSSDWQQVAMQQFHISQDMMMSGGKRGKLLL